MSTKDFFISYTKTDRTYALTIRGWLEDAGHSVVMQDADFGPGSNFVLEMDRAAKEATRTIGVLSPEYLASKFTQPEWAAAFAADPTGAGRRLVLIRVKPCEVEGLLRQVVYADIVGLDLEAARQRILDALAQKPTASAPVSATPPPAPKRRKKPAPPGAGIHQTATAGRDVYQAAGDVNVNKKEVVRPVLPREEHHVTEAQAAQLLRLLKELGERDEEAGRGSTYGRWMDKFKKRFDVGSYARLDAAQFDAAVAWIKQQKAINRPSLRRPSHRTWRADQYKVIHACANALKWPKPQLHEFASEEFALKKPLKSLKELGEQNLEKLAGIMRRRAGKER